MSEVDLEAAEAALAAELPDDDSIGADFVEDHSGVEDNQAEPESFTGFDPNTLPEDMQQVYKSMQADYTRKTQEIAEARRQYEALAEVGVEPDQATNILNLWKAMDSDPQVAAEFAAAIQTRLQEVGYDNQKPMVPVDTPVIDNESYDGLPPALARELQEMREFRQQMVEHQQQQELLAELDAQEQTIRTTNPHYTEDDISAIYDLAHATSGDLMAAQARYHAIQQQLLGNYLQTKQVPHGATPAPAGPASVPGRSFGSLDEAHKAAMEAVRNIS